MTTAPSTTDLCDAALAYVRECLQHDDDTIGAGDFGATWLPEGHGHSAEEMACALRAACAEACTCETCGGSGEVWGWGRDASMGRGSECEECGGTGRSYETPSVVLGRLLDDDGQPLVAAKEAA